jgi:phytoene synthase
MGVKSPEVIARACDLGVAMQLSNIARDVGEDARAGRLYLPRRWLAEAGIDADRWLRQPEHCEGIATVVRRLLRAADVLYQRVDAGIERLPSFCRPGIRAARLLYAEIGHEVERQGYDSISRRAVVPARRKAPLLARALVTPKTLAPTLALPPLDAVRFLVEASALAMQAPSVAAGPQLAAPPWSNFGERVGWVIELFGQLEQRQKIQEPRFRQRVAVSVRPTLPALPWWNLTGRLIWVFELLEHIEQSEKVEVLDARS